MKNVTAVLLGAMTILVAACGGDAADTVVVEETEVAAPPAPTAPASTAPASTAPATPATAVLRNRAGDEVGQATFRQEGNEVVIEVNARNLEGGDRAIHIHAVGQCEGPAFASTGDHFNPGSRAHGLQNPEGPHAGDLPNLHIDPDDGIARETFRTDRVSLREGEANSLLGGNGTALIIHGGRADDGTSQPAGNAGDPVVCGVITAA